MGNTQGGKDDFRFSKTPDNAPARKRNEV